MAELVTNLRRRCVCFMWAVRARINPKPKLPTSHNLCNPVTEGIGHVSISSVSVESIGPCWAGGEGVPWDLL